MRKGVLQTEPSDTEKRKLTAQTEPGRRDRLFYAMLFLAFKRDWKGFPITLDRYPQTAPGRAREGTEGRESIFFFIRVNWGTIQHFAQFFHNNLHKCILTRATT